MSTKERKWFVRLGSKKLKEEEAVLHEALKVVHFFPSLYVTLSSFHSLDRYVLCILRRNLLIIVMVLLSED
ncbi:hypothetical protein FF1_037139 [Malus domestica]